MAETCHFCGEVSVIEESIEGGREQKICIECGSLAAGNTSTSTGNVPFGYDFDIFDTQNSESNPEHLSSSIICISCGVSLSNDRTIISSEYQLCEDCLAQEKEEQQSKSKQSILSCSPLSGSVTGDLPSGKEPSIRNEVATCRSCGSVNLSLDSVTGDERLVCTECGAVCSDSILVSDRENTVSSKYHKTTLPNFAKRRKMQQGLRDGLEKISNLCSKFHFTPSMRTEADEMFKNLYLTTRVRYNSLQMKEYIAAVCLFIVCRQNDLPISLRHFERHVGCYSHFLRAKRYVVKILNIALPNKFSITTQSVELLQHLKFGSVFMDKVRNILFLFRRAWLTQGRSRPALISIAAYYAYLSSDHCKKYVGRSTFSSQYQLARATNDLWVECHNFLCKLAQSLPWLKSKKVTRKMLPLYINSILEYQESLFHLVFQSESEVNVKCTDKDPVHSCHSDHITCKNTNGIQHSHKEILLPPTSRKSAGDVFHSHSQQDQSAPIPSDIDLDSPHLQENEFEEEINSYILSSEERERVREGKLMVLT